MITLFANRRAVRFALAILTFGLTLSTSIWMIRRVELADQRMFSDGELALRVLLLPILLTVGLLLLTSAKAQPGTLVDPAAAAPTARGAKPYIAQVVGVQWLNPLQRRDYPTEWQLLWTLGLVKPNIDDDMLKADPALFSKVQAVASIASGNDGEESFEGFHEKYLIKLIYLFHDNYFSDSRYFYNAHSIDDKSTRRELAGIHVEYALPQGRLDPLAAADVTRHIIRRAFSIGNKSFPNSWTRSTPPDVHVTTGGPNAGFSSLSAALTYLEANPKETVWVMNWDAPNFPPNDEQINENMVLLVLAGPEYKTDRAPLAWIGQPSTKKFSEFATDKGKPPRSVQAWKAAVETAAQKASKQDTDIGYVVHDANTSHPASSERIANLAQTLTVEVPELDFLKQTFNTPALLGEMGAGTALTNVALAIAYANHMGKNVLVAGTTDPSQATAVMVSPPAKPRPIDANEPWFRARGGNTIFLPWWGLRHDAKPRSQGYSN